MSENNNFEFENLSLADLQIGEKAIIKTIKIDKENSIFKLMSLGLKEGSIISLKQKNPTYILKINETLIAIESKIAKNIFITKI
jgi:Fe2+ transport system protein FeoA